MQLVFYSMQIVKNYFLLKINKLYRWLLDIIVKDYTVLNSKLKNQNAQSKRNIEIQSVLLDSSSRLSIHSIVFKSIKELVLKWVILLKSILFVRTLCFYFTYHIAIVGRCRRQVQAVYMAVIKMFQGNDIYDRSNKFDDQI